VGQANTIALLSSESNNRENSSNGTRMDCENNGRSDGALIDIFCLTEKSVIVRNTGIIILYQKTAKTANIYIIAHR
jgi:hypothetical protein